MQNLTIALSDIVYLVAFGVSITVLVRFYHDMKKPFTELRNKVQEHDKILNEDYKAIQKHNQAINLMLEIQIALLEHEIYGNSIDNMKELKEKAQQFMIEK